MARGKIHIGTSGWHYTHWVGPFYPENMHADEFLDYYTRHFGTVEINNTFYQLPASETLADWRTQTPRRFRFACKASRYITHMKKLKDPDQSTARFFDAITALGDKLGPILFQLPPRWRADPERLEIFLDGLPAGRRYTFEFRDETWFSDEIYELLARQNAAFCIYDLAGHRAPIERTADFVYVRLHGPDDAYQGSYDGRALSGWGRRFRAWSKQGVDVYCYFDNDEKGYAAQNALRLIEMTNER